MIDQSMSDPHVNHMEAKPILLAVKVKLVQFCNRRGRALISLDLFALSILGKTCKMMHDTHKKTRICSLFALSVLLRNYDAVLSSHLLHWHHLQVDRRLLCWSCWSKAVFIQPGNTSYLKYDWIKTLL